MDRGESGNERRKKFVREKPGDAKPVLGPADYTEIGSSQEQRKKQWIRPGGESRVAPKEGSKRHRGGSGKGACNQGKKAGVEEKCRDRKKRKHQAARGARVNQRKKTKQTGKEENNRPVKRNKGFGMQGGANQAEFKRG